MRVTAATHRQLTSGSEVLDLLRVSFGSDVFARHYHETYTIGLVRSGTNKFLCNRRYVEVGAGSICVVNPGEVHDGGREGSPWSYESCFPSLHLMQELASEVGLNGDPVFRNGCIPPGPGTVQMHRFFSLAMGGNSPDEAAWQAGALALSVLIMTEAQHGTSLMKNWGRNAIARDAIGFMSECWDARITLAEIASAAGASPFATIRAVAAQTGLTPHALLVQIRVQRAKGMICAGKSIAEAAHATGFADQAHLTREMKRRLGVTPGILRH